MILPAVILFANGLLVLFMGDGRATTRGRVLTYAAGLAIMALAIQVAMVQP